MRLNYWLRSLFAVPPKRRTRTAAAAVEALEDRTLLTAIPTSASDFAVAGEFLYMSEDDGESGRELWRTDGNLAQLAADIWPGSQASSPSELVALGDLIVFRATTPESGSEPWVTDGTVSGTRQLKDIVAGESGSSPSGFYEFQGELYFDASGELWKTDGTTAGTQLVSTVSQPRFFVTFQDALYFSGNGGLWRTDGTDAGTEEVSSYGLNQPMAVVNDVLFFATNSRLHKTTGLEDGTTIVSSASGLTNLTAVPEFGGVYFRHCGPYGCEPYSSDGDTVSFLKDIVEPDLPGSHEDNSNPRDFTFYNERVYFIAGRGSQTYLQVTHSLSGTISQLNGLFEKATSLTLFDGMLLVEGDKRDYSPAIFRMDASPPWNGGSVVATVDDFLIREQSGTRYLHGMREYGDAPASYHTTVDQPPARHRPGGPQLGQSGDSEISWSRTSNALGDSDDGVAFLASLVASATTDTESSVLVTSGEGWLDAWIDFNGNGEFDHPAEHISGGDSISLLAGETTVPVTIPSGSAPGTSYARFRISTTGGLGPNGEADDGEVEDYQVLLADASLLNAIDISVAPSSEGYTIRHDGGDLVVSEGDQTIWQAEASSVATIDVVGGPFTIDTGGGVPVPVEGLSVSGAGSLTVTGQAATDTGYVFNANDAGSIDLDGSHVIFAGTNDHQLLIESATLRVSLGGRLSDDITVGDDALASNGMSVVSRSGWGELLRFQNPDDSLVINAGWGRDTVLLDAVDELFAATITVNGDDEDDMLIGGASSDVLNGGYGNDVLYGELGDDTLSGGSGKDLLYGKSGNDILNGGTWEDTLEGGEGDDTLGGGSGDDSLFGGRGRDSLTGDSGSDFLEGNDGNDVLSGGEDNDHIYGGLGDDALTGGSEDDRLNGGGGDDVLEGGDGNDTLNGQSGNDVLTAGAGDDRLFGGAGDDQLGAEEGRNALSGHAGDDTLQSGSDADRLYGGPGADVLNAGDGDNTLNGQSGNDTLTAGADDDRLYGGADDDVLDGGDGADRVRGHGGDDTLSGGEGADTIDGGSGLDWLTETVDQDAVLSNKRLIESGGDYEWVNRIARIERAILTGTSRDNSLVTIDFTARVTLMGEQGDDYLVGGSAADVIDGGDGNDYLRGRQGDDSLTGGDGNDTLNGGTGFDRLFGGHGNDGLSGWTGDDLLSGNMGDDTLLGLSGNDAVMGGGGDDIALGGDGDDRINGQSGRDTVAGNAGTDVIKDDPSEIDESFTFWADWVDDD